MKDDAASRLSVNHAIRDSEIAEVERLLDAADPGEWRVRNGVLERYSGPFEKPEASLALAAKSRDVVPRFIKGIRVLEEALAYALVEAVSLKNELSCERQDAKIAALNRSEGRTGPEWEPAQIARLAELWAAVPGGTDSIRNVGDAIATYFRRWLGGETVGADVRQQIEDMERRLAEHDKFKAEREAEEKATRDKLRGWVARLESGDVPPTLATQWARLTKQARAAYLKEQKA